MLTSFATMKGNPLEMCLQSNDRKRCMFLKKTLNETDQQSPFPSQNGRLADAGED